MQHNAKAVSFVPLLAKLAKQSSACLRNNIAEDYYHVKMMTVIMFLHGLIRSDDTERLTYDDTHRTFVGGNITKLSMINNVHKVLVKIGGEMDLLKERRYSEGLAYCWMCAASQYYYGIVQISDFDSWWSSGIRLTLPVCVGIVHKVASYLICFYTPEKA